MIAADMPHQAPSFDCVLRAWQAHERELLGFLILRTQDRFAAEDLLQEVFLKAMRQGQGFCSLDNPRAWLFQVARHALIDAARLAKSHVELSEALIESLPAGPADAERSPLDELDACIEHHLAALEAEQRQIIAACDLQGQTVKSYAHSNGLTLAAAKSRLLRARQRLRDRLVRHCEVRFDDAGQVCCHTPRTSG